MHISWEPEAILKNGQRHSFPLYQILQLRSILGVNFPFIGFRANNWWENCDQERTAEPQNGTLSGEKI